VIEGHLNDSRLPLNAGRLAYEVQLSVAGLVVALAAPPVALTPVREGMEK
jgi:hypothetical protein